MFKRVRREPLIWFLLAGLLLFLLYQAIAPADDPASRRIHVTRAVLLEFLQVRARSFNEGAVTQQLDTMSPQEVAGSVRDFVREEAMYREAVRLGLQDNDYAIKRRLVQSLEYVADGEAEGGPNPDDRTLRQFYSAHRGHYLTVPNLSFSHIFFDASLHGWEGADELARKSLAQMNANGGASASILGDRFLYFQNYAERTPDLVESHFGSGFAKALIALRPNDRTWQGPLRSDYGYHLVLLTGRNPARVMPFEQAKDMVAEDYRQDWKTRRQQEFTKALLASYDIDISRDVKTRMAQPK